MRNHIENSGAVSDKKGLLYFMTKYADLFNEDINEIVPATLHFNPSFSHEEGVEKK